jgi:hypothetical protein
MIGSVAGLFVRRELGAPFFSLAPWAVDSAASEFAARGVLVSCGKTTWFVY